MNRFFSPIDIPEYHSIVGAFKIIPQGALEHTGDFIGVVADRGAARAGSMPLSFRPAKRLAGHRKIPLSGVRLSPRKCAHDLLPLRQVAIARQGEIIREPGMPRWAESQDVQQLAKALVREMSIQQDHSPNTNRR